MEQTCRLLPDNGDDELLASRLVIKDELLTMRLRGRLVVPLVLPKAVGQK